MKINKYWHYIEQLANTNVERSIDCHEIFHNPMKDVTAIRKLVNADLQLLKNLPLISVSIADLVPTQNKIYLSNLKATKEIGNETGAQLICKGGKYYIFDGHHRIANRILQGHKIVSGYLICPIFIITNYNRLNYEQNIGLSF